MNTPALSSLQRLVFYCFAGILLFSIFAAFGLEQPALLAVPAVLIVVWQAISDYKVLFYLMWFTIPLSTEVDLPGFSTDFPDELLMLGLTGIYLLKILNDGKLQPSTFLKHPITILLFVHLFWILITTLQSEQWAISLKYAVSKIWYVVTFYFLTASILNSVESIKKWLILILIPLVFTVIVILIRHYGYGFSFEDVGKVMSPFYRNHVNYACILALFTPYIWLLLGWYKNSNKKFLIYFSLLVLIVGIQFSYTRAAYVAVFAAIGAYYIIQFRLTKWVLATSLVGLIGLVVFLEHDNKYLDFAPDYNKTITHQRFDRLIEATYKMEDISTMERVYRWVAGSRMIVEHPFFGFGPGNFYSFYKGFTVSNFKTYVSDNPEHSGIHCYYLMLTVEQGLPGLIFFLTLLFAALLFGEKYYHALYDPIQKRTLMAILLSLIIIALLILINDMIETDKVGTFFFTSIALIANASTKWLKQQSSFQ